MQENSPDRIRWNARYDRRIPTVRHLKPAEWLVKQRHLLSSFPGGKALDIACGLGQNSMFLLEMGFEVDAVDISDTAIAWLQNHPVVKQDGNVFPHRLDLNHDPFPNPSYQVIINFRYLQRALFPTIVKALAPGGLLIFETFCHPQSRLQEGDHFNPHYLLDPGELITAFEAYLQILYYEEGSVGTDKAPKCVARMVAKKSRTNNCP